MLLPLLPLLLGLLAAEEKPVPAALPPSGKWTVDYEPDMCIVSRSFGTGPDQVMLAIQPSTDMASTAATLYLVAPERSDKSVRFGTAVVTPQSSGKDRKVDYASAVLPDGRRGYRVKADEDLMRDVATSSALTIRPGGGQFFTLATGPFQHVLAALAQCNDNLFKSWGVDPTARAVPTADPGKWYSDEEYPASAKQANAQGRTVLVLTVSPNGRPSACKIVVSAKNADLDKAACAVARFRGRFVTSSGAGDRYTILSIRWALDGF